MTVIEVPFEFERNQIVVQVRLNGQGPFRMYVDTLTDPSAIEITLARRLALAFHTQGLGEGQGSEELVVHDVDPVRVDLGDLRADDVAFLAADLSKLSVDGVLGYSLLGSRLFQIDFPGRRIRFYEDGDRPEPLEGAVRRATLPFGLTEDFLLVLDDVWINGRQIRVSLDSGASSPLLIFGSAVPYLGLEAEVANAAAAQSTGYRGAFTRLQGQVDSVRVGDLALSGENVSFIVDGPNASPPLSLRGANLGNGLLQDFVLTIDYPNLEVTFEQPG